MIVKTIVDLRKEALVVLLPNVFLKKKYTIKQFAYPTIGPSLIMLNTCRGFSRY